jgi:hypothetical protein
MIFIGFYCTTLPFRREAFFIRPVNKKCKKSCSLAPESLAPESLAPEISYMRNKFRNVRKRQIQLSGFEFVFLGLISRNRTRI